MNISKILFYMILLICFLYPTKPGLAQVSVGIGSDSEVSAKEMDIHVSGDWYNAGSFSAVDSKLIFAGTDDQYIIQKSGSPLSRLEINKSGGRVILGDSLFISDTLALFRGNIISSDTAVLFMKSGAVTSGGADSSFVEGPFAGIMETGALSTFKFPAGAGQDYRPITVELSNIAGDTVIVMTRQINENAQNLSTNYLGLDKVSLVRYWKIDKSGPGTFTSASVTFNYDTTVTNDGVEIASELRVAHLIEGALDTWEEMTQSNTATVNYKGAINSGPIANFGTGFFTFGDAAGGFDISLPVELSNFELSEKRGDVNLNWKTESEVNNSHWLIQRKLLESEDEFETIARLEGHGTFPTETFYTFIDQGLEVGEKYAYRLADVSISGRAKFHDEQAIEVGLPGVYALYQNYPNPFNPATTIKYDLPAYSDVRITVYNILGQRIRRLLDEKQKPGYYKLVWDGNNDAGVQIASGMYIFTIQAFGSVNGEQKRFQKAKKMVMVK